MPPWSRAGPRNRLGWGLQPPGRSVLVLQSPARLMLLPITVFHSGGAACGFWDVSDCPCPCVAGVGSFLLYSVHEGIRGIPLDPNDKSDALVPVSGTSLAVGIDFHAGDAGLGTGQGGWEQDRGWGA